MTFPSEPPSQDPIPPAPSMQDTSLPRADPSLPRADWYPDPDDGGQLRYWNGQEWTDHRAPRVAGLRSVGDWLSATFTNAWKQVSSVAWLWAVIQIPVAIVLALIIAWAIEPIRLAGFRDDDFRVDGVSVSRLVLAGLVLVVGMLAYGAFTNALRYVMYHGHRGTKVGWSEALAIGVRRIPRWVLWGIVTFALVAAVLAVFVGLGVAVAAADILGLLVLIVPIAFVALAYLGVHLYFVLTAIAVGPDGSNPLSISWQAVKGKFWPIFGRVLLWGILASIIGSIFNTVISQFTTGWLVDSLDTLEVEDIAGTGGVDISLDGRSLESIGLSDLVGDGAGFALALVVMFVFSTLTQTIGQALSASADTNLYHDLEGPAEERVGAE